MKQYLGLVLIGLCIVSCSPSGESGNDLGGVNPDLGMMGGQDLGVTQDLAPSGPGLALVAGGLGGIGNADGVGTAARFFAPQGVAWDGAGNLFAADTQNHIIRQVVLQTGVVTTIAGMAGVSGSQDGVGAAARFNQPAGVVVDASGNLYISEANQTIRKLVLSTGQVTTFAGTANMTGSTDGTGAAARFSNPQGLAIDSAGNVYIADTSNFTIRKMTPAGVVTTLAGTAGVFGSADGTGAAASFRSPSSVAVDSAGNVYVADTINSTIRKVTPAGVTTTLAGRPL